MKTLRWVIASSMTGILFAGTAMAQTAMTSMVQQPGSIRQMAYQSDDFGFAATDATPAPAAAPASPSNTPPAPAAAKADDKKADAEKPKDDEKKDEEAKPEDEGPVTLFHGPWLDEHHLSLRGFADVGFTANPTYPMSGFNGPNGYNALSNQLEINQFYGIAERVTKIENDCGIDYGYRGDLVYGADAHFLTTAVGSQWDSNWNGAAQGGGYYYGLAMPQLYGDLAINKLLLRGGHYYAPCGFEVANADGNFFYSHSYGFLYGMPTTLTGGYGTYKVKDKLLVNVGFDTGWNEFEAVNGKPNYMFGVNWTSPDKDGKINVVSECFIGNTQTTGPGITDSTRVEVCTDINVKLGDKWTYTLENTVCHDSETPTYNGFGPASWTGFTNYLIYAINDCWGFGFRYEYFEDLDGAVVPGFGFNSATGPVIPSTVLGSKYNDLTLGLNWKPNKNVTARTEVRWDWASNSAINGQKPYGDGMDNSQFTWGNDVIVRF